jgi:hypothetical protein
MNSKKMSALLVTCGLMILFAGNALSQEWYSIREASEHIGIESYPELTTCGPADPVGTVLTITFNITELSPWAYLYLEAVGVDPDGASFQNKVFFNNQEIGTLTGYEGFDCNEWDTLFMAGIGGLLNMGGNEIRIESGFKEGTEEWDDFWVRHIRIYPDTVPETPTSWSKVKAVYR